MPAAEQADQTDGNQVNGHDEIEQTGHEQDKDAGDQREQGAETEMNIHGKPSTVLNGAQGN